MVVICVYCYSDSNSADSDSDCDSDSSFPFDSSLAFAWFFNSLNLSAFAVFAMWLLCDAFFAFHFALQLCVGVGGVGGEEETINGTRRSTQQTRKNMKQETRRSSVQQLPTATSTRARPPFTIFHPPSQHHHHSPTVIYKKKNNIGRDKKITKKNNGFEWRTEMLDLFADFLNWRTTPGFWGPLDARVASS